MLLQLLLLAFSTLISEDLTCIAAGVLIAQGKLSFTTGVLACLTGIMAGDLLLFVAGRFVGRPALNWRPLARILPPDRVERASVWLTQRGLSVVFFSRFTPGLRTATYFAAGLLATPFWRFAGYFALASAIWTPLLVGSTVFFGNRTQGPLGLAAIAVAVIFSIRLTASVLNFESRRRLIGFVQRKIRWEFWPAWAAYLPLLPYLIYLAIRHRSLTLFTAANPGIPTGGFVGESKSQILELLGQTAEFSVIRTPCAARNFMSRLGLTFPVVLKPDVGERGSGVAVVDSDREMVEYLERASGDVIIQRYIPGVEFGVFYYRFPNEARGRIFSITEKRFPEVTGDGQSTLTDLVLRDPRAVCMASAYLKRANPAAVPAAGERVRLVELGSHCRGAIFLDGSQYKTPALEEAINRISQACPGFYFGRYDLRAVSVEAFMAGDFRVIELNGVAAEATHIYDPAVSLWDAYRAMFKQWRIAFEIGAMNRACGVAPTLLLDLLRAIRDTRLDRGTAHRLRRFRRPVSA